MKKLRAFLAVDIVEGIRDRALQLMRSLADVGTGVKWVEPENLHITLKFLGDINDVQAWEVSQSLEPIVASQSRFNVTLKGLGAFPALNRPRSLWVGLIEGEAAVKALFDDVDAKLRELGYPSEQRRFHAHLTLGRVRGHQQKQALISKLEEFSETELGTMEIAAVTLYSSQLRRVGPHYSRMATMRLED